MCVLNLKKTALVEVYGMCVLNLKNNNNPALVEGYGRVLKSLILVYGWEEYLSP